MRTSGSRLSSPDHVDDAQRDVHRRDRVLGDEQHRVAEGLDHPAAPRGDDVGAAGLEDLHQVADPVLVQLVGQRGEAAPGRRSRRSPGWCAGRSRWRRAPRPGRPPPPGAGARRRRSSCSKGTPTCSASRSALPIRLPVASSPASSCSTRADSVATCQSASLAIVWPTARVSRTAVSKSIAPVVDGADQRAQRDQVGLGEGRRVAGVGEAERPPQPTGLLDGDAGRVGERLAGQGRVLAQDRALQVLAGERQGQRSVIEAAFLLGPVRAVDVRAVGVAEQQVADLQVHLLDVRDVGKPDLASLARVGDDQRAAAEHPVDDAVLVGDVVDPRTGMSWPRREKTPVRVMSRRSVRVYVVVSQFRNGQAPARSRPRAPAPRSRAAASA